MGLKYIYNGTVYDMSPYENPTGGIARLNIINGTRTEKYGFTSNSTASQYAPMKYLINGRVAYIGMSFSESTSAEYQTTRQSNYETTRQSNYNATRPSNSYSTSRASWYNTYTTYLTTSSTTNTTRSTSTSTSSTYQESYPDSYYTYIASRTSSHLSSAYWVETKRQTTYPYTGAVSQDSGNETGTYFRSYTGTISGITNTNMSSYERVIEVHGNEVGGKFDYGNESGNITYLTWNRSTSYYRTEGVRSSTTSRAYRTQTDYNASRSTSTNTTTNTYRYNGEYFSSRSQSGETSRSSSYSTTSQSNYNTTRQSYYNTSRASSYNTTSSSSTSTDNYNM